MAADLFQAGYDDQVNVDFSRTAIKIMEARYESLRLEWQVMDVRQMVFGDNEFDVAIDKVRCGSLARDDPLLIAPSGDIGCHASWFAMGS